MLVHVEIAAGVQFQIERTVPRNEFEHVVEEANSRGDARFSVAVEIQFQTDVRLVCSAGVQAGGFHSLRINFRSRCISDCVPMEIRTKPGPISLLRSRRRIPCFSIFRKRGGPDGPKFAKRKFPALGYVFTPTVFNSAANHARKRFTSRTYPCIVAPSFTAASAPTRAARLTGKGGMARRTRASDFSQAITAPRRKAASPATFEKVLATNNCGYLRIHGTAEKPENSA